jgi:hypothetical protein
MQKDGCGWGHNQLEFGGFTGAAQHPCNALALPANGRAWELAVHETLFVLHDHLPCIAWGIQIFQLLQRCKTVRVYMISITFLFSPCFSYSAWENGLWSISPFLLQVQYKNVRGQTLVKAKNLSGKANRRDVTSAYDGVGIAIYSVREIYW